MCTEYTRMRQTREHRGSDVMSAGPSVRVSSSRPSDPRRASAGGASSRSSKTPPRARSGSRADSGGRDNSAIDDPESMAEKLTEMTRRLRESERECTLLRSRLQRSDTESQKKDKTIEELLNTKVWEAFFSADRCDLHCHRRQLKLRN